MRADKKVSFSDLKHEIIDKGLCLHCNICIETCPVKAINESDKTGSYNPILSGNCTLCGTCFNICPGKKFNFPEAAHQVFGDFAINKYIGHFKSLHIGYAKDTKIRGLGSSGGVVTALLLFLLRTGQIKGASCVTAVKGRPWIFTRKIVENESDIIQAAQSKYTVPQVIDKGYGLHNYKEGLAFVGLPCQIHALRKYEMVYGRPLENIKFYIGLYCGNQLYFDATEHMLSRFGIKDYNIIKSIEYRAGPWPGKFKVSLLNGKIYSIPRIAFNYLSLFYEVRRCLTCADLTSEYADISVGDGWMHEANSDGLGYSVIIARSARGKRLLDQAQKQGVLKLEPISEKDAIDMHAHLLDNKKIGAFIRMSLMKFYGRKIPEYNLPYPSISAKRCIPEFFMGILFYLGSLRTSKYIVNLIPLSSIEKLIRAVRKSWIISARKKISQAIDKV